YIAGQLDLLKDTVDPYSITEMGPADEAFTIVKVLGYVLPFVGVSGATFYLEDYEQAYEGDKGKTNTAWSYEDSPSNMMGLKFYTSYYDPDEDFATSFEQFLTDMGATNPEAAPNWAQMKKSEQITTQQFERNFSPFADLSPTAYDTPETAPYSILRTIVDETNSLTEQVGASYEQFATEAERLKTEAQQKMAEMKTQAADMASDAKSKARGYF
ncbi:MAG: hypothetical protein L0287_32795, partial [Anaerolineae bacterium]|nr:hypothetical protein [Anaerolineae bacterium]